MYISKKYSPENVRLEKSIFINCPYWDFYSNIFHEWQFTSFFFKISFWFIEMLGSGVEVIKKFSVIELSVPFSVYSAWSVGETFCVLFSKVKLNFKEQTVENADIPKSLEILLL